MSTVSMNIRTDVEIKKQAEAFFAEFGLNMTTAVNMFLRQVVRTKSIPLNLSLNPESIGSSEGKFVHKGEGNKNINDLAGKIHFIDNYDHKALREGHK